jgi:hypothetical protein
MHVRSKYSCGVAVVVLEQAPEPLPTTNGVRLSWRWRCSRATRELEEFASVRAYKFVFVAMPLKILGATASPVRPIALVAR